MRRLVSLAAAILVGIAGFVPTAIAQIENIPAPAKTGQAIPVYRGDTVGSTDDEVWTRLGPMTVIRNVTRPTIQPFLPDPAKANGAAVVLAPGGGMLFLALPDDEVARRFNAEGIAVFVLKYRVTPTPREIPELRKVFGEMQARSQRGEESLSNEAGFADGRAAVALLRERATEWKLDPAKIGVLGFSSGAEVARAAAISKDPAGRPDFVGLIYGAMDPLEVPASAPPMFAAIAMDDTVVRSRGFPVVESWREAGRPVELHAYQTGGHGFVTGGTDATHLRYLDQFVGWLRMQGFLPRTP